MARRRFDLEADPVALINAETLGSAPVDPFLSSVAPGLVGGSDARFASKELNIGRGAVTGGRAFRSPRVRSKSAEEEAAIAAELSSSLGSRNGQQASSVTEAAGQSGAAGLGGQFDGIGSVVGQEFGMGILSNIAKNIATTGAMGVNIGASAGQIAGAVPGAIAGAVKGGLAGPLGAGLGMLGVSDAVASPIGAANTIGGLAGTMASADIATNRARNVPNEISSFADIGQFSGSPEARAAAERAAAPVRGTGLLGLLGEGAVSLLGDFTGMFDVASPIEQAEEAIAQSEFQRSQIQAGRLPGDVLGQPDRPGMLSRAGSAIGTGMEAIGGFGSRAAAEEAGFTYNVDDKGQISIDPPTMFGEGGFFDRRSRRDREGDQSGINGGNDNGGNEGIGGFGGVGGFGGGTGGGFDSSRGFV
jgi:hypothetical protein